MWLVQLGQKFSQPPVEDVYYSRTRSMLTSLGLQNYEKNFKKGLLTDTTLPLLTDRQVVYCFLLSLLLHSLQDHIVMHICVECFYFDVGRIWHFIKFFGYCSALRDVNIPPGPRLLILDHIQRSEST